MRDLAPLEIPEDDTAVFGYRESLIVCGAKGHASNACGVSGKRQRCASRSGLADHAVDDLAAGQIPHDDAAVRRSRESRLSIRADRYRPDIPLMSLEAMDDLTGVQIPQNQAAIEDPDSAFRPSGW